MITSDAGVVVDDAAEGQFAAYPITQADYEKIPRHLDHSCAGHPGDFCFFCEFEPGSACPDDTETDLRADLSELVQSMMRGRRELRAIVAAVHRAYEESVRPFVRYENESGQLVERPEWSRESIRRHLTISTEFRDIFSGLVERVYQGMLMRINSNMITDDGRIDPEAAKQWTSAVKGYTDFCRAGTRKRSRDD